MNNKVKLSTRTGNIYEFKSGDMDSKRYSIINSKNEADYLSLVVLKNILELECEFGDEIVRNVFRKNEVLNMNTINEKLYKFKLSNPEYFL